MISSRVKNLKPYVPGEQCNDRAYIKLNANENPYPPSPKVCETVLNFVKGEVKKIALYPDPDSTELKNAIAGFLNGTGGVLARTNFDDEKNAFPSKEDALPFKITKEMIFCGNGSDEVLSFLFYAFFEKGERIFLPEFTYSFYPVYCGFYGIPYKTISMKEDFSIDIEKIVQHSSKNNSPVIIANPNAPTGLSFSKEQMKKMLNTASKEKVFIVDEAYVDFGGMSCLSLLEEFPNLIVVRTFSKSMSGAGLRLGYVVANPKIVNTLTTVKNSFNHFPLDAITQVSGIAACNDISYYAENVKKIVFEREKFYNFLRQNGWSVFLSHANFLFAKKDGLSGRKVYEMIKNEGILVRHFDVPGIEDRVRISVGTKEEMDELRNIMEKMQLLQNK